MRGLLEAVGRVEDRHNRRLAALIAATYNAPFMLCKPDKTLWTPGDFSGDAAPPEIQSAEAIERKFLMIAGMCKALKAQN